MCLQGRIGTWHSLKYLKWFFAISESSRAQYVIDATDGCANIEVTLPGPFTVSPVHSYTVSITNKLTPQWLPWTQALRIDSTDFEFDGEGYCNEGGIPSTPYLAPLPNVSPKLNNIITYLIPLPYASNSFSEYTEFNLSYESHRGGRHLPGLCAHLRCKEARLGRIPNGQLHAELAPRLRHRLLRTRRPIPQHRQQWVSRAHSSRIFNCPKKIIITIFAGPAKIAFSLNSPVQLSSMPWVSTMWKSCALATIYASRNHTCVRNTGSCTRSVKF